MKIACFALDVDGVLTDGRITYTSSGEEIKSFHAQDGLGLSLLKKLGIPVAIITGRTSPIVERRAQELGIGHLYMGVKDKRQAMTDLCEKLGCTPADVAYMGDDLNDLPLLTMVGYPMAPANASRIVQDIVRGRRGQITKRQGGDGAVREMIDALLQELGLYEEVLATYCEAPTTLQQ